jgi:class 3 adenylate cyclase/tetratricopeptide (TPR) repeat protein
MPRIPMTRCASCAAENPAAFRFCGGCGRPLVSAERSERRVVTVLFADVVGFTALAESSDPEAVAGRVDSALRRVAGIITAHGGSVDKYLGDALMAVFGLPLAHDDDASRAVAAALAITAEAAELQFSLGVNTGEVLVTQLGGGGDSTVIGDTVNVASRLENLAGPGEVLLGPLTAELVGGTFELEERPAAVLKGRSNAVPVWRAVRSLDGRSMAPPGTPILGRDSELDFLLSIWRRVAELGRSRVVLLSGDAGMGKTRLLEELTDRIRDNCQVAHASCPGYGALVGTRLASSLGRELGAGPEETASLSFDEGGVLRLRRLIAERCASFPLLLAIDDVHRAQPADLDALAQLAARLTDLPVLLLLAGRSQPAEWMARFGGATTIRLEPLPPADAERLAQQLGQPLLDAEAAALLAAQSSGNPLHLRELVRLVLRRGSPPGDQAAATMPATLQALLAARLDELAPADKAALQAVAIFSDGATAEEVAAVNGGAVSPALDHLVDAGVVSEREQRFLVRDPLLREVAYEQLSHAARGEWHRRAAAVAATDEGAARHLGLAAGYLDDPELRRSAAAELSRTGTAMLASARFRDGVQLLRRAVELGAADPATLLRLAQAEVDLGRHAEAAELLHRIDPGDDRRLQAEVIHALGNAEGSAPMLDDAAQRWRELGDPVKLAWALANRGVLEFTQGRLAESSQSCEEALQLFRQAGDRQGAAAAGRQLALTNPDDPRVPTWLADGLQLAADTGDVADERNALIPIAWSHFIRSHFAGDALTAAARDSAARLVQVASDIGDTPFEVHGRCMLAVIARMSGRLDDAAVQLERARAALRRGASDATALVEACGFMVDSARGIAVSAPAPPQDLSPLALVGEMLVLDALLLAGHIDPALCRIESSPAAGYVATPLLLRIVGTTHGALLVLAGRTDEAQPALALGIQLAGAAQATATVAALQALLAEVLARRGDRDEARSHLDAVVDDPGGVAAALVLRSRVLLGESDAAALAEHCRRLVAPGLTLLSSPRA